MVKRLLSLRNQPRQERSQETMENIIQATAHILEKEGFEKTSTNKIAAKAGVSIGSLYQYFSTKESILSLLMEKYIENQMNIMDKALKEKNSADLESTIRAIICATLESKRKNRRFTKIFAQKIFDLNKLNLLKKLDEYSMKLFKEHIEKFSTQLRQENLDLSLYIIIQCVKLVPVTLMFNNEFDLDHQKLEDELVHLTYQYLRK